jgi:GTPase SAR1 family protein
MIQVKQVKDFEEVTRYVDEAKHIVVIGFPGSGKSTLVSALADGKFIKNTVIVDTDHYKDFPYGEQLTMLTDELERLCQAYSKILVVGILGYRLLRHLNRHQVYKFKPDLVIEVTRDAIDIENTYKFERGTNKLAGARALAKGCETVLKEYLADVRPGNVPYYLEFYNKQITQR